MVARNWPRADLIRNQTGGSTGTPITFYLSGDRKCSRAAATLRHNRWAGWEVGDKAAVIWGAPRDRPADDWRSRLRGAAAARAAVAGHRPTSPRTSLADVPRGAAPLSAAHHPGLRARRPCCSPAICRPAACTPTGRTPSSRPRRCSKARIGSCSKRCSAVPVFNRYGCREVSVIASECAAHSGLHVMAEGLYLEIETPHGPAAPGEMGAILVTDLLNHAMPLIRYRIGDLARWADGACPCGRGLPRLERVAGRVTDFLVGCDGRLVSGVFLATYVVAQRPSLGQVQIRQHRAGAVTYRIKPGRDFNPDGDLEYLRRHHAAVSRRRRR